eukprot:296340_1
MSVNIPKVFRMPRPRPGIKRGFEYKKQIKKRDMRRSLKKRQLAKEIAIRRWEDKVAENSLQPQPIPIDENGIPEEIKYQNNLRQAYREKHYQTEYFDPTPYITDQKEGEKWFLNKMGKLDNYQQNRKKWKSFLNSTSLSTRVIGHNMNKIPNNQAPITAFWNKQTVDWLSVNRWKELHRHGMHGRHMIKYFKKYDRCPQYREWPAHNEVIRAMHVAKNNKHSS